MINNYELIKFIFNNSKKIKNSDYSWKFLKQIINANVRDFKIDIDKANDLYIWLNGKWYNGTWEYGIWYDGIWKDGEWIDGNWYDGNWYNGTWYYGKWHNGIWYNGDWYNGDWYNGIWKGGIWRDGYIWNPKTKQYEPSNKSPNKCEWSLSYGK